MTASNVETTDTAGSTLAESRPTAAQAKAALAKAAREKAAADAKAVVDAGKAEQALKSKLRSEATAEVIEKHRDEFNALAEAKFAANGLVFARRMTEAEKAAKKIADLLAAHPELAGQFAPAVAVDQDVEMPTPEEVPAFVEAPVYVEQPVYSDPAAYQYDPNGVSNGEYVEQ